MNDYQRAREDAAATKEYRRAEQRALLDLAVATLANPDAPHAARVAASARLVQSEPDLAKLSTDEVRALVEAMRTAKTLLDYARGAKRPRPEPQPSTEPQLEPAARSLAAVVGVAEPANDDAQRLERLHAAAQASAPRPYSLAQLGLAR